MPKTTMTTPAGEDVRFDAAAHTTLVAERRTALRAAEDQLDKARTDHTDATERLEELQADMGSGRVTGSDLVEQRAEVEIAAEVLRNAERVARSAARAVPNDDTTLALSVAASLRHLLPDFIQIVTAPVEVNRPTTLPGHLPAVILEQTQPAVLSPGGVLSSGKGNKPLRLRVFSEAGLDVDLTGESIFRSVWLDGIHNAGQLHGRTTSYSGEDDAQLTERSWSLPIARAVPTGVPVITERHDAERVAMSLVGVVKAALRGANLRGIEGNRVEVRSFDATELPQTENGETISRHFKFTLSVSTSDYDHGTLGAKLRGCVSDLSKGAFFEGVGRVTEASVLSEGTVAFDASWAGYAGVEVALAVTSRPA